MGSDFRNRIYKEFQPYLPGEQPDTNEWVKLNTNENPYPPSEKISEMLTDLARNPEILRKYPNPSGEPLRSALAKKYHLEPENFIITNGSDEALAMICRVFMNPEDSAAAPEITYSLYKTLVAGVGASYKDIPPLDYESFDVDLNGLKNSDSKIIFLSNPNAQTGEFLDPESIENMMKNSDKLWVIDEAYNDFVSQSGATFLSRLKAHSNLIVVRTFSKSYSLAGMRIGYAAASNPELINGLLSGKDSYNEDTISILTGKAALEDQDHFQKCIELVQSERARMKNELEIMGFKVIPSQANFLLAYPPDGVEAESVLNRLKEFKILIRFFRQKYLDKCIRITIGTPEENSTLLNTLEKIL